jgi:hypothetical protein
MTIGRIGGPMLKENLIRQGVDLSFETNLLYLDVNNMRIGVNTDTPTVAFDINGTTRFGSNLQISGGTISTYASNNNITLSPHGTGTVSIPSSVTQASITAPSSPSANNMVMYVTASGVSPNREIAWKIKTEDGNEIIISSVLV